MKTTKRTSLNKRIEKLTASKKLMKSSLVYGWVSNLQNNEILRPVYSQGSTWKHSSLVDKSYELTNVLKALKIKFSTGNDAARGGRTGYYVEIITKIKD